MNGRKNSVNAAEKKRATPVPTLDVSKKRGSNVTVSSNIPEEKIRAKSPAQSRSNPQGLQHTNSINASAALRKCQPQPRQPAPSQTNNGKPTHPTTIPSL